MNDLSWAVVCESALRSNPMYEHFFARRRVFLTSFMRDEIAFRRRTGYVVAEGPTIVLLGPWPAAAVPATALSRVTVGSLKRLPPAIRARWVAVNALNANLPDSPHLYLSAICTRPSRHRQGHGASVMAQVAALGDGLGLDVYLATSAPWLVAWYRRQDYDDAGHYPLGSTDVTVMRRLSAGSR